MNTRDLVRLRKILKYTDESQSFVEGRTRDSFEKDVLLTRALCYAAVMVGQIAAKFSSEFQDVNPQIPWQAATTLRDYLPNYALLDHDRLWMDITETLPNLATELRKLMPLNRRVKK